MSSPRSPLLVYAAASKRKVGKNYLYGRRYFSAGRRSRRCCTHEGEMKVKVGIEWVRARVCTHQSSLISSLRVDKQAHGCNGGITKRLPYILPAM